MATTTPEIAISVSSGIQALATIVLIVITAKQIKWSGRSVESMERSTKANFLPVLMLGLWNTSDDKTLNIELSNCGKGLAIRPKISFPGQPDITLNSIDVGGKDNATVEYKTDFILTKVDEKDRNIIIEYRDVFGRKIITKANLVEKNNLGPAKDKRGISWDTWEPIIPAI